MRESCPLQVTIRYLLMFVHRRDLVQSSVSRTFTGDRVRERNAKSHLYTLLIFEIFRYDSKYKNPVDSLILGWGEETRGKCKEIFWFLHTRVRERVRGAHHSASGFNSKYIRTSFNTHRQQKQPSKMVVFDLLGYI